MANLRQLIRRYRFRWQTRRKWRVLLPTGLILLLLGVVLLVVIKGSSWPPSIVQSILLPNNIVGRASVVDGDTIEIRGTPIRLFGVDAPESSQSCTIGRRAVHCGQQATMALIGKIGNQIVECHREDVDRYGRMVATCAANGEDLSAWMVAHGWALAYRYYSAKYVSEEEIASKAKIGMWQGSFERPWDWRHNHSQQDNQRSSQSDPLPRVMSADEFIRSGKSFVVRPPSECVIKGNISAHGRIYHLPGDKYYDRTGIDQSKGERWFCSETEAQAAGWRRAGR